MSIICKRKNKPINCEWKEKNKLYLKELQVFFDIADKIENEDLQNSIISQMLRCDKIVTNLAEDIIQKNIKNE